MALSGLAAARCSVVFVDLWFVVFVQLSKLFFGRPSHRMGEVYARQGRAPGFERITNIHPSFIVQKHDHDLKRAVQILISAFIIVLLCMA